MKKILVIEDEELNYAVLKKYLQKLDYQVCEQVFSGEEALEVVKQESPDMILMDVSLEGEMDGFQTAKSINNIHNIPIIFVSAEVNPERIKKAELPFSYGYLVKPINFGTLQSMIELAFSKFEAEKKLKETQTNLNVLFDNILQGITFIDKDYKIKAFNKTAKILAKSIFNKEMTVGQSIFEYVLDKDRESFIRTFQKSLNGEIIRKDKKMSLGNSDIWLTFVYNPIKDENEQIIGVCFSSFDITERKIAEERAFRYAKQLKEAQSIAKIGNWEFDIVNNKLFWSDEIFKIFNLEPQAFEATYESFLENVHPDDRKKVDGAYKRSLKEKKPYYDIVHRLLLNNGEIKYVWEKCHTEFSKEGEPLVSRGIVYDLTEQKIKEQELERRALLAEQINEAVLLTDMNFTILRWNKAAENVYGYTKEEAIGKNIDELLKSKILNIPQAEAFEMMLKNGSWQGEIISIRKDGQEILLDVSITLINDDAGKPIETLSIVRDITEKRRMEKALQENEERLKRAESVSHLGSWEMEFATGDCFWSDEFFRNCGYEPQAFKPTAEIGFSIIHPDDREKANNAVENSLKHKVPYIIEKRIVRPNGEIRYVLSKGEIEEDENGNPKKLIGSFLDITEIKQMENQLREKTEFITALLDNLQVGVVACDKDGNLTYANEAAKNFHGLPENYFSSSPKQWSKHHDAFYIDETEAIQEELFPLYRTLKGEDLNNEEIIIVPNNSAKSYSVLINGQPIKDFDGNIIGGLISMNDYTELKKAQSELSEMMEKLKRSNEELSNFTSIVSHDLKNPLNAIIGGIELLEMNSQKCDAEMHEIIDLIDGRAKFMATLINDLLNLSRLDSTRKEYNNFSFEDIITHSKTNLYKRIKESDAELTYDEMPEIKGDFNMLVQLMQNLIENAIKYNENKPRIHISFSEKGKYYLFSLKDNGIGIPDKIKEKVFDMFSRFHKTYEGTGIGLATCKKIVQIHGGDIWVESNTDGGSTFYFTLLKKENPSIF